MYSSTTLSLPQLEELKKKCRLYLAHVFVVCFLAGEYEILAAGCDTILGEKSIHYNFETTTNVTFAQDKVSNNWLVSVDPKADDCHAEVYSDADEDEDDGEDSE